MTYPFIISSINVYLRLVAFVIQSTDFYCEITISIKRCYHKNES